MSYSDDALRFATIPATGQVRFSDRISYVYLERVRIVQTETGVVAVDGERSRIIQVPASSLAVIALGPGTTITHAAAASIAACGATILWTGGGGHRLYAAGVPLTSSSKWAQAQARLWASKTHRVAAARMLYRARFSDAPLPEGARIATLRALEGAEVKAAYRRLAAKHRVRFRRDTNGDDPVNIALNVGNSILYGLAASTCAALGLSPALGIIHHGDSRAFLFDLGDVYKLETSVPLAFACASEPDPAAAMRRKLRAELVRGKVMDRMLSLTMRMLEPHLDDDQGDRLLDDGGATVPGHANYGPER